MAAVDIAGNIAKGEVELPEFVQWLVQRTIQIDS
jgi:hypothetical protein